MQNKNQTTKNKPETASQMRVIARPMPFTLWGPQGIPYWDLEEVWDEPAKAYRHDSLHDLRCYLTPSGGEIAWQCVMENRVTFTVALREGRAITYKMGRRAA